jgi:hypothetical protein
VTTVDLAIVRGFRFPPVEHSYAFRDTTLYALGLGFGEDPLSLSQLTFVYEDKLKSIPVATRALIETYAPGEPERLTSMFVRFSKPVFPGETIVTEFFESGAEVRFRCRVKERDVVVLDRGAAAIGA